MSNRSRPKPIQPPRIYIEVAGYERPISGEYHHPNKDDAIHRLLTFEHYLRQHGYHERRNATHRNAFGHKYE